MNELLPQPAVNRLLAAALAGDTGALARALDLPRRLRERHRVEVALARRAVAAEIGDEGDRRLLTVAAVRWSLFEGCLADAGSALAAAGVPWLPIKGCDLASRVYETAEERPTSDVDLLVAEGDLDAARGALVAAGWRGLHPGALAERYLREEGYAWQATRPQIRAGEALLEVHHRLWGLVPRELAVEVLATAVDDPRLPGRRPSFAAAWLLAAVHGLLDPPPRPLLALYDLERIAGAAGESLGPAVVDLAGRHDLALPAALAAGAAEALWPGPVHTTVRAALVADLRLAERAVWRRAVRRGADAVSLPRLALARLLAGRRRRLGWRAAWRRLWPHPGVVEQTTPAGRPWPLRRLAATFPRR